MKIAYLAAAAASLFATAASAQSSGFTPGAPSTNAGGFTIINTFTNTTGLTGSGYQIKSPPTDGDGAPPANSSPSGTSYLSVLGGGSASYDLGSFLPSAIRFDWGSIDRYNTFTVLTALGQTYTFIPGTTSFPNAADGNQFADGTNGLFTVTAAAGDRIRSVNFASSNNSFEVDNFAVSGAVPEPATWAMMIGGFGLVGGTMRRRKVKASVAFA